MRSSSYDIVFITSDKTEGGIQRALIDWASVILENQSLRFASITAENRFSRWLATHHPQTTSFRLSAFHRIMIRHFPAFAHLFFSGKMAKIAFVHNGFACAAAQNLALHVIGICHNDKPHHFKAADQLICLTPRGISLAKQQGWTDDRLILLPHYHDCQHDRLPEIAPATSLRISAAGRFVPKKNFELFIAIAGAVQAERPDIQFTLAGDGPNDAFLKQMATHKGATINFTGWTDMDKLASQTDLFILPSTDEPFGYVLAEMMDAGVAVLSTPSSGADYLLDGGKITPLISPDELGKWVETILMLADNPALLKSWRKKIFKQIRSAQFSRQAFSDRLALLISDNLAQ